MTPLIFILWPIHSEKKWEETYFVLNGLFFKVGVWNKSFYLIDFIDDHIVNILIIGL